MDGNMAALNQHMKEIDEAERALEFFTDDTEKIFDEIEDLISKIKEIANGYEHDFSDEIKSRVMELL